MENSDIQIEVVYNGLIVKLNLNGSSMENSINQTFIFKSMKDFSVWFDKNLSSPKKSKEYINSILSRQKATEYKYNAENLYDSLWHAGSTHHMSTYGQVK